jgi:hypothetical protein
MICARFATKRECRHRLGSKPRRGGPPLAQGRNVLVATLGHVNINTARITGDKSAQIGGEGWGERPRKNAVGITKTGLTASMRTITPILLAFCLAAVASGAPPRPGTAPAWPRGRVIVADSHTDRLRNDLDRPVRFAAADEPITVALARLSDVAQVDIELDPDAVEAQVAGAAVVNTLRLSGRFENARLRKALETMLEPHGLTFTRQDERIRVTSESEAARILETRVYQVHDLVADPAVPDAPRAYDKLVDILDSTVDVESWQSNGNGPGVVEAWESPGLMALVIVQRPETHDRIARFFDTLRAGRAEGLRRGAKPLSIPPARPKSFGGAAAGDSTPAIEMVDWIKDPRVEGPPTELRTPGRAYFSQRSVERRTHRALRERLAIKIEDETLGDALRNIAHAARFEVQFDVASLTADGRSPDDKINFRCDECRLDRALDRMLRPLGLTYLVREAGLVVTTRTANETSTTLRFHAVEDLVWNTNDPNLDDLRFFVIDVVQYQVWIDGAGTPGNPYPVHLPGIQGLVVTQTDDIHREVEELFAMLRRARLEEVYDVQRRRTELQP